jgi:long-chain acyl-CoA synthetase
METKERTARLTSVPPPSPADGTAVGPAVGERRDAGDPTPPCAPGTLTRMFFNTVSRRPDKTALMHKEKGGYRSISYRELAERVRCLGRAFVDLGVRPGECIALLSENRPEWAVTDLAALCVGAANVSIYTTLTPPQVQYILRDCGAKVLIVSNEALLKKALAIRGELPELQHLIMIEALSDEARAQGVLSFTELLDRGNKAEKSTVEELERRWQAAQPGSLASLIYTSGTTGDPKGARLTHNNFYSNAHAVPPIVDILEDDVFLSFLPLSHVFERLAGHYLPLCVGATIAYAESLFALARNMEEIHPSVMASTPRLFESMHQRILETAAKAPPARRRLFQWALGVGRAHAMAKLERRVDPVAALQYPLADRLVLAKIRAKTGGRIRYFISGGAPLPRATAEFFFSLGLTILEGYGLTETSPVICVNRPGQIKLGTVGPPMPGVEVRIAADGEILSRGPHIMEGYHNKPEETKQAIDADGWFHTGDIGRLDPQGRLSITDRKKDIIVLATGKNVAPQPIEAALKASPYIAEIALIGDRQNILTALVVPAFDAVKEYARARSLGVSEPKDLVQHPEIRKLIKAEIDRLSKSFADFERVRRFTLLDHEFTVDSGLLTPTMKLKRRVVAERYAKEISTMRGGEE